MMLTGQRKYEGEQEVEIRSRDKEIERVSVVMGAKSSRYEVDSHFQPGNLCV